MSESDGGVGDGVGSDVGGHALEATTGDILSTEGEHAVLVGVLSELNGDWGRLVDDEVAALLHDVEDGLLYRQTGQRETEVE